MSQIQPASAPRGIATSHIVEVSASTRNLVSPPPRRTPFVRMVLVERKMMIMPMASMS